MTAANKNYLVIGLGVSGMSVVRYLGRIGAAFEVVEGNVERYQALEQKESVLKSVRCHKVTPSVELLSNFDCVVVSPGVSVRTEVFNKARASGVEVITSGLPALTVCRMTQLKRTCWSCRVFSLKQHLRSSL